MDPSAAEPLDLKTAIEYKHNVSLGEGRRGEKKLQHIAEEAKKNPINCEAVLSGLSSQAQHNTTHTHKHTQ